MPKPLSASLKAITHKKLPKIDTTDIIYRAEELITSSSNRYRITVQVANRAKRRRFEEYENNTMDEPIKPVLRAIMEMSDEINEQNIISD